MADTTPKFTWVQTHKELAQYLRDKQDDQKGLIELLKEAGSTSFKEPDESGNSIDLIEIDPFTFFGYIHKYGDNRRLSILQNIAEKLNLSRPEDVLGIPTTNAISVRYFPYKNDRKNNEIERLWSLFYDALDHNITDEKFVNVLSIHGTGKAKLTEGLFYIDPETYLPINSPVITYLSKHLSINEKFKNFQEYQQILDQVKEKVNLPIYEISKESWKWTQEFEKENAKKDTNYWIFQGRPDQFDVERALLDNALSSWRVNTHKNKVTPGDKVIVWASGQNKGCYALGEVKSDVYEGAVREDEMPYYNEDHHEEPFDQVDLEITHNLAENPIVYEQIKVTDELSDLKAGKPGENNQTTQDIFEALMKMATLKLKDRKYWLYSPGSQAAMWDEFYDQGIMAIGWDELGDLRQYNSKKEIAEKLQKVFDTESSKSNDAAANWEFYKEISKGDVIIAKKNRSDYIGYGIVTSDYFYDEERSHFKKCRNVDWNKKGNWTDPKGDIVIKTLTDITPYEDYVARIKKLIDIDTTEEPAKMIDYPLNTIFYGPPGTGKTYNTAKRAAEIVEQRVIASYVEARQIFNENLGDTIEFITFHQNYSYEDFIQGIRPDTENSNELTFEKVDGVFKKLANRALKNLKESRNPQPKKKPFERAFNEYTDPLIQGEVENLEVKMKRVSYFITTITNRSIEFQKASGASNHTLSIGTLKKMYEAESVLEIQGLASYYNPLLEELLKIGKSPGETELIERKNYVLIIDEISRANSSRVIGELITLIEPDKRSGEAFSLTAKLPSGEDFTVPSNLYIIGTMNTADKSIALLDIALRRRFEFEAMYPKYEIDGETIHDADVLRKLNGYIKETKGHDFQIGHSYFMKNDISLEHRINRKVIPLLLEYYMNDEKEVRNALMKAGLEINEEDGNWPLEITGRA